jgi:hypothetical protein
MLKIIRVSIAINDRVSFAFNGTGKTAQGATKRSKLHCKIIAKVWWSKGDQNSIWAVEIIGFLLDSFACTRGDRHLQTAKKQTQPSFHKKLNPLQSCNSGSEIAESLFAKTA